jgi:hypothetical protein
MIVTLCHSGLVLECELSTWPASKGARDGKYGPPLEPDEDAGFDVDSVKLIEVEDELNEEDIAAILADDDAIYQAVADELNGMEPDYE